MMPYPSSTQENPRTESLPDTALWHIMTFLVDWTLGPGSVNDDEAIDMTQVVSLRLVCKQFHQSFEYNHGLTRLNTALRKEHNWKIEQHDYLENARGVYEGGRSVGNLLFDNNQGAQAFCRQLEVRMRHLSMRANKIRRCLRHETMAAANAEHEPPGIRVSIFVLIAHCGKLRVRKGS